jgi:hypothetical protein
MKTGRNNNRASLKARSFYYRISYDAYDRLRTLQRNVVYTQELECVRILDELESAGHIKRFSDLWGSWFTLLHH